ncbi:hypothetical protein D3C73_904850 [compost metagenome]
MVVVRLRVIPNQSGIKSYCSKHCENHHTGEGHRTEICLDSGEPSKIDYRYQNGNDENIQH